MAVSHPEEFLLQKFIGLMREIGRVPTKPELQMKCHSETDFPSYAPFRRLGSKQQVLAKIRQYCQKREHYQDIVALCKLLPAQQSPPVSVDRSKEVEVGHVYLMKSGRFYKIGRSNASGRREYELAIQMPEKLSTIHIIRTDDPVGIEAYWHNRFAPKRKNGEWFDLAREDVSAFKRRKFM